jgi:hypothetical protein
MSNFTPLVNQEYEFEGDKISITFSRLKRKDMLASMPALKRLTDANDSGDEDAKREAINDVLNNIADVLPGYVTSFEGLADGDGSPVAIEAVCETFYFMKLAAEIATGMLQASSGAEGKA